eukprot:COSAG01_NODE_11034_length_2023_cov_2.722973_1_plen_35_part_10
MGSYGPSVIQDTFVIHDTFVKTPLFHTHTTTLILP